MTFELDSTKCLHVYEAVGAPSFQCSSPPIEGQVHCYSHHPANLIKMIQELEKTRSENEAIIHKLEEQLDLKPLRFVIIDTVFNAIQHERDYQDSKWGHIEDHPHDIPGWLLIMEQELREAKEGWVTNTGDKEALKEILQIVAVGVAALEQHGVVER